MSAEAGERPRLVFSLTSAQPAPEASALLEEEREKHRQRAAKFGVEYTDPAQRPDLRHESRKERFLAQRAPQSVAGGVDLFSEEEIQRRKQRAERFGTCGAPDWEAKLADSLQDQKRRQARAAKFDTQYVPPADQALMDVDVLEGRHDVPLDVERRRDTVHVYGVDLMSTKDVLRYFEDYGPRYVEWINDSACNVLFGDETAVQRAVVGRGVPLAAEDQMEAVDPADIRSALFLWYRGEDFAKGGTRIPLLYRVATVQDAKPPPSKEHVSRGLWKEDGSGGKRQRHRGRGGGGSYGDEGQFEEGSRYGEEGGARQGGGRGGRRRRRVTQRRQLDSGEWVEEDIAMMDVDEKQSRQQQQQQGAAGGAGRGGGAASGGKEDEEWRTGDDEYVGRFRADCIQTDNGYGSDGGRRGRWRASRRKGRGRGGDSGGGSVEVLDTNGGGASAMQ